MLQELSLGNVCLKSLPRGEVVVLAILLDGGGRSLWSADGRTTVVQLPSAAPMAAQRQIFTHHLARARTAGRVAAREAEFARAIGHQLLDERALSCGG